MKNKQVGYYTDISYDVTGYYSGITSHGTKVFYVLADSYGEAYNKIMKIFDEYTLVQTRCKDSGYYDLDYTVKDVHLGKRILDTKI